MIAQDFLCQRVPATESVSGYTVEEARARWRKKDKRRRIKRSLSWLHGENTAITY